MNTTNGHEVIDKDKVLISRELFEMMTARDQVPHYGHFIDRIANELSLIAKTLVLIKRNLDHLKGDETSNSLTELFEGSK